MSTVSYHVSIQSAWSGPIRQWWVSHEANGLSQSGSGSNLTPGQTLPVTTISVVSGSKDHWSIFFLDYEGTLWGTGFEVTGDLSSHVSSGTAATLLLEGSKSEVEIKVSGQDTIKLPLSSLTQVGGSALARRRAGVARRRRPVRSTPRSGRPAPRGGAGDHD